MGVLYAVSRFFGNDPPSCFLMGTPISCLFGAIFSLFENPAQRLRLSRRRGGVPG